MIAGAPMCPNRQINPAQLKGTGELVSERLRELVSQRLSPVLSGIADEMREEHVVAC